MTMRAAGCHSDAVSHLGDGVLRPPVPGEEDVKRDAVRPESYEPEGRASPDHAHPSWAESLSTLLEDQDGIVLFRDFLSQEGSTDIIDFWLACSGFRLAYCAPLSCSSTSADILDKRRLRLAKAIYRKYITSGGIVAKKIKAATKSWIRERVRCAQLDSALFERARQEVQDAMEVETYPVFLRSDVYLTYAQDVSAEQEGHKWEGHGQKQETGSNKKEVMDSEQEPDSKQEVNSLIQEPGSGTEELKQKEENVEVPRFIPEVVEKREWVEPEIVSANHRGSEHWETGYRMKHRIIQGCVRVDTHKTSLFHKLSTHRRPQDVHTEPCKFAADLISRLELVQREREDWRRAEDHLHPVCTEVDDAVSMATSSCPAHPGSSHSVAQWCDAHAQTPDIVPDEREQGVRRTPRRRSPVTHTHSHTWRHGDTAGANQRQAPGYRGQCVCVCESMTVAYYFCGELIPYRTTVRGGAITLGHFRELLTRRGAYRFFFKKPSEEFDCGVVYEEVCEDNAVLPVFEGRIVGKVEKIY
ncbi:axin-1-like [Clarias gariepinus]|uniref:axin-1-like n=1 Tax=Clarias gariepinus TaxID=13013 RepID=UPI00234C87BF|nr:axin-1-like [Clarias gariepinus]XP_053333433.1 axin-1-like [Clarias gariepinus]